MKAPYYLIKIGSSPTHYLNGYNPPVWEWTFDKKTAWRMDAEAAKRRLAKVQEQYPSAELHLVEKKGGHL